MKKLILLIMALFIAGCGSDSSDNGSSIVEIPVQNSDVISSKTVNGRIATVGEVDRYFVNLAETGRNVQIKCVSETVRSDVELLVNVFEENSQGELVMVAGDHGPVDSQLKYNVKVSVFVDTPKKLYINVRDLMDDDSSSHDYTISASYEAAPDGNGTFESAADLTTGGDAVRDFIGSADDTDCFHIQAAHDGVYDIYADFDRASGSDVRLQFQIFDEQGNLIEARNQGNVTKSHLIHYLEAGNYYVLVNDQGKDDFDNLSYYEISVDEFEGVEAMGNDTPGTATVPGTSEFSGSIDYFEDIDTYAVDTDVVGTIKVMDLAFESDIPFDYLIELHETIAETTTVAFSHQYKGGENGDGTYMATLKLDNAGSYNMVVRPVSGASVATRCPYTVTMDVTGITDADEAGDGNNVESDAIDLSGDASHTGKVAYRGDSDWYAVTFPLNPTTQQVLSLDLDVPVSNLVQYAMKITCSAPSLEKIVFNSNDEMRDVDLKTGILVPMGTGNVTYSIKVYDFQNDNGDKDKEFILGWSVTNVLTTAPAACPKDGGATVYHNENDESGLTETVSIEYSDSTEAQFKVDTQTLSLGSPDTSSIPVTVQFPWISGYIDYQNDEDWFRLDLTNPLIALDDEWYYTINVEFYAANSEVEYTWEYRPDSDGDSSVSTRLCNENALYCNEGIQAVSNDETITPNIVDTNLEDTGNLWIGKGSETGSIWKRKVLFRISDFNYVKTDETTWNPNPDNDWGYDDAPYYFRVTVKYYNGALQP